MWSLVKNITAVLAVAATVCLAQTDSASQDPAPDSNAEKRWSVATDLRGDGTFGAQGAYGEWVAGCELALGVRRMLALGAESELCAEFSGGQRRSLALSEELTLGVYLDALSWMRLGVAGKLFADGGVSGGIDGSLGIGWESEDAGVELSCENECVLHLLHAELEYVNTLAACKHFAVGDAWGVSVSCEHELSIAGGHACGCLLAGPAVRFRSATLFTNYMLNWADQGAATHGAKVVSHWSGDHCEGGNICTWPMRWSRRLSAGRSGR